MSQLERRASLAVASRAAREAARRRLRPHRIAIFVFLVMAALFFCVPLYVIVVTSFKTMDEIRLGEIFSLPQRLDARRLALCLDRGVLRHALRRRQRRLRQLDLDPGPEPRS